MIPGPRRRLGSLPVTAPRPATRGGAWEAGRAPAASIGRRAGAGMPAACQTRCGRGLRATRRPGPGMLQVCTQCATHRGSLQVGLQITQPGPGPPAGATSRVYPSALMRIYFLGQACSVLCVASRSYTEQLPWRKSGPSMVAPIRVRGTTFKTTEANHYTGRQAAVERAARRPPSTWLEPRLRG